MRLSKSFQLALNILFHSKLRSWLTIIGIIIGIGAVVAIISISEGAQRTLQERLGGLGADIITVSPGYSRARGAGFGGGPGGPEGNGASTQEKNLTSKDIMVIKSIPNVKYVLGQVSDRADVTFSSKTATLSVIGVDTSVWKDVTTSTLSSGRFLTQGDSYSAVIGANTANSVFGKTIALNNKITIEGKAFNVVGILSEGSSIYIPIETARNVLPNVGQLEFNSISVKIADVNLANDTMNLITSKLMLSRGIIGNKKQDFSVSSPISFKQTIQQTMSAMALFLGAIAAISLIVGAVGIANTMFTSVLEKTREIGMMKAIGAKNRDILLIFLFNSGLIGLVGGIGGIIVGVLASETISSLGGIQLTGGGRGAFGLGATSFVSPTILIVAILVSVGIGMIAGAIPAYRASKLNPVDALRYE